MDGPRHTSLAALPMAIPSSKRYIAREVFSIIMRRQKDINATRIAA